MGRFANKEQEIRMKKSIAKTEEEKKAIQKKGDEDTEWGTLFAYTVANDALLGSLGMADIKPDNLKELQKKYPSAELLGSIVAFMVPFSALGKAARIGRSERLAELTKGVLGTNKAKIEKIQKLIQARDKAVKAKDAAAVSRISKDIFKTQAGAKFTEALGEGAAITLAEIPRKIVESSESKQDLKEFTKNELIKLGSGIATDMGAGIVVPRVINSGRKAFKSGYGKAKQAITKNWNSPEGRKIVQEQARKKIRPLLTEAYGLSPKQKSEFKQKTGEELEDFLIKNGIEGDTTEDIFEKSLDTFTKAKTAKTKLLSGKSIEGVDRDTQRELLKPLYEELDKVSDLPEQAKDVQNVINMSENLLGKAKSLAEVNDVLMRIGDKIPEGSKKTFQKILVDVDSNFRGFLEKQAPEIKPMNKTLMGTFNVMSSLGGRQTNEELGKKAMSAVKDTTLGLVYLSPAYAFAKGGIKGAEIIGKTSKPGQLIDMAKKEGYPELIKEVDVEIGESGLGRSAADALEGEPEVSVESLGHLQPTEDDEDDELLFEGKDPFDEIMPEEDEEDDDDEEDIFGMSGESMENDSIAEDGMMDDILDEEQQKMISDVRNMPTQELMSFMDDAVRGYKARTGETNPISLEDQAATSREQAMMEAEFVKQQEARYAQKELGQRATRGRSINMLRNAEIKRNLS